MTNPSICVDRQIVGDIYTSSEALDNLTSLCDEFGSRFGGTEGERLSAEYIVDKFKEYGLSKVHLEPFDYLGWTRGDVRLEITSPIRKTIPCITLPHSPPVDRGLESDWMPFWKNSPFSSDDMASPRNWIEKRPLHPCYTSDRLGDHV